RELLDESGMETVDAGCVIQAYLKDSLPDLSDLVAWSSGRRKPVSVRLVKGAYWDAETIHSRAEGWPVPVFEHTAETDANYERCTRFLPDHQAQVRAAYGAAVQRFERETEVIGVPAVIGGKRVTTTGSIDSVDPAATGRVVARSAACGVAEADAAVAACLAAWSGWRRTPAADR